MRTTISGAFDEVVQGTVRLVNNVWNSAPLVIDKDYTHSITYDPADLTRNVDFRWDFRDQPSDRVYSYPEIVFGQSPWDRKGPTDFVTRIDTLRDLDVTIDVAIEGDTGKFNNAFDLWFTDTPTGRGESITTELMIWTHALEFPPEETPVAVWTSGGQTAKVYVRDNFTPGLGLEVDWRYIAVIFDKDVLQGTIDVDGLIRFLTDKGYVSSTDYMTGVEFGAEVVGGKGGMTLNSIDIDRSVYAITDGADRLVGTAQNDVIAGRGGNDVIVGLKGSDRLSGDAGDDMLRGDAGGDRLLGGAGKDMLNGGAQVDVLTGGAGADIFVFKRAEQLGASATACDRITDFGTGADRIDLAALDAVRGRAGNQTFDYIGKSAFTGDAGELRAVRTGNETLLLADRNGDGVADMWLQVSGIALREAFIDL